MSLKGIHLPNLTALMAQTPPDSVVSRVLVKDEHVEVTLFSFAEGQGLSEHSAPLAASIQILEGEVKFTLGTETVLASAGDFIYMPPNLPHSLQSITAFKMLLTMIQ